MTRAFNLALEQCRRLDFILQQPALASWRPDGRNRTEVAAMVTSAEASQGTVLTKTVAWEEARAKVLEQSDLCRETTTRVVACARSMYRRDRVCRDLFARLPRQSYTVEKLAVRMKKMSEIWAGLPVMPNMDLAFSVGSITRTAFDAMHGQLTTRAMRCGRCQTLMEAAQSDLRNVTERLEDFAAAALRQGRNLFAKESPEWVLLDTVPTQPGAQEPGLAEVTSAVVTGPGAVHLELGALHATSFSILSKRPEDGEYVVSAQNITGTSYTVTGLEAGDRVFRVIPHNSRGDGEASPPVTVRVPLAAAA